MRMRRRPVSRVILSRFCRAAITSAALLTQCAVCSEQEVNRVAVALAGFESCFFMRLVATNGSMSAPQEIAQRTCTQVLQTQSSVHGPVTFFNACQWDIALRDDSISACVDTLSARIESWIEWTNRVQAGPNVLVPVSVGSGGAYDVYFVPRSQSTTYTDGLQFCTAHAIPSPAQCASSVATAADEIYNQRLPFPSPSIRASLCPGRKRVGCSEQHGPSDWPCRPSVPLVAFYHVAAIENGPWEEILKDQVNAMADSGLLSLLEAVHVNAAGSRGVVQEAISRIESSSTAAMSKFIVDTQAHALSSYEYPTLTALQSYCRSRPEALVLYIHTKGASRPGPRQPPIRAWRRYLEHFVVWRHRACVSVVAHGHDTCGVHFADDWSIYGGNMWWARCDYVAELPDVSVLPTHSRYMAEKWIGLKSEDRGYCPVSCHYVEGRFLYDEMLDPAVYEGAPGCDAILQRDVPYHELHRQMWPKRNTTTSKSGIWHVNWMGDTPLDAHLAQA